jgi:hypothetical protein
MCPALPGPQPQYRTATIASHTSEKGHSFAGPDSADTPRKPFFFHGVFAGSDTSDIQQVDFIELNNFQQSQNQLNVENVGTYRGSTVFSPLPNRSDPESGAAEILVLSVSLSLFLFVFPHSG